MKMDFFRLDSVDLSLHLCQLGKDIQPALLNLGFERAPLDQLLDLSPAPLRTFFFNPDPKARRLNPVDKLLADLKAIFHTP